MDTQLPKLTSHSRVRRARNVHRFLSVTIGLIIAIAVVSLVIAYAVSESKINHQYAMDESTFVIEAPNRDVVRGEQLVKGLLRCTECHERDLGGKVIVDTEIGRVAAPNLTSGEGGIGAKLGDADWVRALRHGVGRDGHGLWMMPTARFNHLTDRDLGDVIAFIKGLPRVDRASESSHLGLLGRLVHAIGKLELIDVRLERQPQSRQDREGAAVQGKYLSLIGGCSTCHGEGLTGGEDYQGSDLVNGSFRSWSLEDFVKAMRQGIGPDSQPMSDDMPWPEVGRLADPQLKALFEYLRSLQGS